MVNFATVQQQIQDSKKGVGQLLTSIKDYQGKTDMCKA